MTKLIEKKTQHILPKKNSQKKEKKHASWDSCHLKQFSNVLPLFFSSYVFLEDWRLGKIEYFIVIRGKNKRAGQDTVPVYIAHFFWNIVRGIYFCHWPIFRRGNGKKRSFSKRWTIVWSHKNCTMCFCCQAFERWQTSAVTQREDEGFESVAPLLTWRRLCKTRKQSFNIRTVQ